jgi:hypothetical protein
MLFAAIRYYYAITLISAASIAIITPPFSPLLDFAPPPRLPPFSLPHAVYAAFDYAFDY